MPRKKQRVKAALKAKVKTGRPTIFSAALSVVICDRLSEGESLRAICRDKEMPCRASVLRWLEANEPFRGQYARARRMGYELMADELADISDGDGDAARDRLRVDTRKWLLSKTLPKIYGDKLTLDATLRHDTSDITDEQIARELLNRGVAASGDTAKRR